MKRDKTTGIIRTLDELGRIVVPREVRKTLDLAPGDSMEIAIVDGCLVFAPQRTHCVFCGRKENLVTQYNGHHACGHCMAGLERSLGIGAK